MAVVAGAGIAGAEAFGTPTVGDALVLVGITSAEVVGSAVVGVAVAAAGVPTAEAVGQPAVTTSVPPPPEAAGDGGGGGSWGGGWSGQAKRPGKNAAVASPAGPVTLELCGVPSAAAVGRPTVRPVLPARRNPPGPPRRSPPVVPRPRKDPAEAFVLAMLTGVPEEALTGGAGASVRVECRRLFPRRTKAN